MNANRETGAEGIFSRQVRQVRIDHTSASRNHRGVAAKERIERKAEKRRPTEFDHRFHRCSQMGHEPELILTGANSRRRQGYGGQGGNGARTLTGFTGWGVDSQSSYMMLIHLVQQAPASLRSLCPTPVKSFHFGFPSV